MGMPLREVNLSPSARLLHGTPHMEHDMPELLIVPGATIDKAFLDALSLDELASFVRLCRRFGVSRIVDAGA